MRPLCFNMFGMDVLSGWAVHDTMPTLLAGVDYSGSSSAAQARLSSPGRQEGITTSFVELTGTDNPFDGLDFGTNTVPTAVNVSGSSALDLVIGAGDGTIRILVDGNFQQLVNADVDGIDIGDFSAVGIVPLDGGLSRGTEFVIGNADGTLSVFSVILSVRRVVGDTVIELTGENNPFDGIDFGTNSAPTFVDMDGDFDLDAVIGAGDGTIQLFENNFGQSFTELTGADNPFANIDVGTNAKPVFVDLDDDGDTDLVVGAGDGTIRVFDKNDDDDGYTELTGTANPFNGIDVGADAAPTFLDIDEDGDFDAIIGTGDGTIRVFENLLPPNVAPTIGGDLVFSVNEGAIYALTVADLLGSDVDNIDGELLFAVSSTRNGIVLVNGQQADRFTNADVEAGLVEFFHNGRANTNGFIDVSLVDPEGGITEARLSVSVTGPNVITGTTGADALEGTFANDLIDGLAGDDTINGNEGNDSLIGGAGSDTINGGAGNDSIVGGDQNDNLFGGDGNDIVNGQRGADFLYGGAGDDLVLGGNRNDRLFGEDGNDRVFGGNDQDIVEGGAGRDILRGGNGDDQLFGDDGNDVIFGGTGRDRLEGGTGDDFLSGRGGFDVLDGGAGDDTLEGGVQADTFVFVNTEFVRATGDSVASGNDTITDFAANNNAEKIDLSGVIDIIDFQDLVDNHMVQDGANVVISFGADFGRGGGDPFTDGLAGSITLLNVDINDLDAVDFIF